MVGGGLAIVLAAGFYLPLTLLAPLDTVAAQVLPWQAPATAQPALDFPAYGAAGVGAVGYPGVLASRGVATALPIASITKVITALTVLEAKPLALGQSGPEITFTDADVQFYDDQLAQDGVVATVTPGQTISERNLLDIMLMASANNYAQTVAAWAFGSQSAFLDAAKAWLAEQGLSQTSVTDPTGILPSNTSTVTDLVQLAKLALAHPVVEQIVSTASIDVPGIGRFDNRNELLGIDGVDGIKTGTLDESGACLLFSAEKTIGTQVVTVVGVVLGGPDHPTVAADVRSLLAQVSAGFQEVKLTTAGTAYASYTTVWGDTATAVAAQDASTVLWSDTPVTVAVHADALRLAADDAAVGVLDFTAGDRVISVPLRLSGSIEDPGPGWRLSHPAELF